METKTKKETETKDTCFVIMPFGGWFNDYYSSIYCPAIKNAGLIPKRADDIYRPSTIVQDIWELTKKAKIVLADLTGKNANVFYELGLAHALAKPAILVTETMADVPFDLRALRVIEYDKNAFNWGVILQEKIEKSIGEILKSPLNAVLPAFLEVKSDSKTKITQSEKELLEIRQDLDLLRREMRMSRNEIAHATDRIPAENARLMIKDLIRKGAPSEIIHNELSERGVPEDYISKWIERYRSQLEEN